MTHSNDIVVVVLDTAAPISSPSDTGTIQRMNNTFLTRDIPLRFSIDKATGDAVVVEMKSEVDDDFVEVHNWSGGDNFAVDIWVSQYWRCRRTVDGGVGESVVKVENRFRENMEADT